MNVTPEGGLIPCLFRNCDYRKNVQLNRMIIERSTGEINYINRQIRGIEMDPRLRGPQFRGHILQACASLRGAKARAENTYRVRTGDVWDRYKRRWGDPSPALAGDLMRGFIPGA
ncbi:hypothetical protein VTN00DRAFT_1787 [Thermoascus crustaceus]|uniref:uncharacterized protein n=1 Tax=Thermoascus crustaceus TaxID=5088 RepID=UPI00374287F6